MNGFEVEYNSGVMTISFGEQHGTYVLNKQPPNKQIWLSSPISGPKRYDYDAEKETWFYSREHVSLGELLTQEFQNIIAEDVDLPIR
ncbi:Frataxin-like protein [Clavulina sp. PMI_390]|nr:Frataxin-like protein [Clavulina sp. PMI_390]